MGKKRKQTGRQLAPEAGRAGWLIYDHSRSSNAGGREHSYREFEESSGMGDVVMDGGPSSLSSLQGVLQAYGSRKVLHIAKL